MQTQRPLRKDGVLPRRVGQEWILYDTTSGSVHVVNHTAHQVWDLCDGVHAVADMAAALRATFDVPDGAPVDQHVQDVVQEFAEMGIITFNEG